MKLLNPQERSVLFVLIEKMVGANHSEMVRRNLHVGTVERYLTTNKISFLDFLKSIHENKKSYLDFISMVTIHSTSWFRDLNQFEQLYQLIEQRVQAGQKIFRVWSAACSTGQEPYSLAMVFERARKVYPDIEYRILGSDIDEHSLKKAREALYPLTDLNVIRSPYREFFLKGIGSYAGQLTVTETIRRRCEFKLLNLIQIPLELGFFDFIFCRNILIYLSPSQIRFVLETLTEHLQTSGVLFLAPSEALTEKFTGLHVIDHNLFMKDQKSETLRSQQSTVLVVEDVAVTRKVISGLLKPFGFEVLEAESAERATQMAMQNKIDLITLDLNLPHKNGVVWLRELRARGFTMPVVILSGTSARDADMVFGAIEHGAQEYIEKKQLVGNSQHFIEVVMALLKGRGRAKRRKEPSSTDSLEVQSLFVTPKNSEYLKNSLVPQLILIGASTGGPEALWKLLKGISQPCPPILIVQHTNSFFAKHLAKTIARVSNRKVKGDCPSLVLEPNIIYMAHDDYHLKIKKQGEHLFLEHSFDPPEQGHRPSVNVLFRSVAELKIPSLCLLLTGMGCDGVDAMKLLYNNGNTLNMAQSEESCVVFGMPKEAIASNCVHLVGDLGYLRKKLDAFIAKYNSAA